MRNSNKYKKINSKFSKSSSKYSKINNNNNKINLKYKKSSNKVLNLQKQFDILILSVYNIIIFTNL